uniref:Uncharacterized protein n=1 Tax=Solanum tuberosum TaxID=4113 RepID=M0ZXV2_SOLTU
MLFVHVALSTPHSLSCWLQPPPASLKGDKLWKVGWWKKEFLMHQMVEIISVLRHRVVLSLSFLLSYLDLENLDKNITVEVSSSSNAVPFPAPPSRYSEISKGRCRAQSCKATLELPSLLPKKLTGECSVREISNLLLIFCGEVLLKSMILGPDSSVRLKGQVGQIMDLLLIAQPV